MHTCKLSLFRTAALGLLLSLVAVAVPAALRCRRGAGETDRGRGRAVHGRGGGPSAEALHRARPRAVGRRDLHHRRHRDARRPGQRAGDRRGDGAGAEGDALRRRQAAGGARAQDGTAQVEPGAAGAVRCREARGAHAARRRARRDVRPRQVLPAGEARRVHGHRPALGRSHHQPRPEGARDGLGRLALDLPADARQVPALRRARERGRQGARLREPGRALALEVRHAAGRLRGRARPALGPGQAALRLAALLRARAPHRDLRQGGRAAGRADSGASPGQHVGPAVGRDLRHREAGERRPAGFRPHHAAQGEGRRRARHGALRRGLLQLARLREAAGDLLGALDVHQAARPRRGLPRLRLGHRPEGRPAHQDVHRDQRRGLLDHPSRARAQLLPAGLQRQVDALPRQRQRRFPRSAGRHRRAVGDAGLPEVPRPHRQGTAGGGRHRPPAADGARQGGLPAVRTDHRQVALGGLLGQDPAGEVQPGLVGAEAQVPGRRAAGGAQRGRLRSGREVPRPRQHALHALLPRRRPAVPVPPRALRDRRARRGRSIAARSTTARRPARSSAR